MNKNFNLEHQYQLYLQRVGLIEEQMHPEQKKQLRQTFMGACGQMLILMRDEVGALPEAEAVNVLDNMIGQVSQFFQKKYFQRLREERGLSVLEVAKATGMSINWVKAVESGSVQSVHNLWKLAQFYSVELSREVLIEYGVIVDRKTQPD